MFLFAKFPSIFLVIAANLSLNQIVTMIKSECCRAATFFFSLIPEIVLDNHCNGIWNLNTPCYVAIINLSLIQQNLHVCLLDLNVMTQQIIFHLVRKQVATPRHFVKISEILFSDSSFFPSLLLLNSSLGFYGHAFRSAALLGAACYETEFLAWLPEYMCFWEDKLSNVSNVSAPSRSQSAPHI